MTAKQREEYMTYLAKRGSVLGLESMRMLLFRLGNPEKKCRIVQIAGTNGKGSILAMLSTILKVAGYKVGTYSSPAVFEEREIIRIGGRNISEKDYCEYFGRMKEVTDAMEEEGLPCPTLFEVQTAIAYLYFAEKGVDLAIVETGLGGRDDATNVCENNLAAVFATISKDHMQILGDTLAKIAMVKAGIMKPSCPVVLGLQEKEVETVLKTEGKRLNCKLYESVPVPSGKIYKTKTVFDYRDYKKLELSLLGEHQIKNAITVLDTLAALEDQGYHVSEKQIRKGLLETCWPGRFEILCEKPLTILDGAHNEDAAIRLKQALIALTGKSPLVFVMGMLKDKEYDKVVKLLSPLGAQIVTLTPPNPLRALDAHLLAEEIRKYNPNVTEAGSIEEAAEIAKLLSGGICPIICFGSLSFLGRIRPLLQKKH